MSYRLFDVSQDVVLIPAADIQEALALENTTEYGLTAAIHTGNVNRAMWFAQHVKSGVANINLGIFERESQMLFGRFCLSGKGTREPRIKALDVYLKSSTSPY